MSTEEGFRLIDEIAEINPNAILILTGGEPLLRKDIFKLGAYAKEKGLMPVLGTNGTLLTPDICDRVLEAGICGVGVSIDSLKPELHDSFRGLPGALENTLKGIDTVRRKGLDLQIQTTVTKFNIHEIEDIVRFSADKGCRVYNLFFLVCTGRGQQMSDISPQEYEDVLSLLVSLQKEYEGSMIIKAKCAPHFKRVAYQKDPDSSALKGYTTDCLAGKHYCRVDNQGKVTPCPYMPESAGNIKETSFRDVWEGSKLFSDFRNPALSGKCGKCEFTLLCGGCRARAFSETGSYLSDDPWCVYEPPEGNNEPIVLKIDETYWAEESLELVWNSDAKERLKRVPFFARQMAVKAVERFAREHKIQIITPEVMAKTRQTGSGHMGGMNHGSMAQKMSK